MSTVFAGRPQRGGSSQPARSSLVAGTLDAPTGPDWRPDEAFRSDLLTAIPGLRGFAMSLCGDAATAEDLVQETLLMAWAKGRLFRPGTNMGAWLCTILRNQFSTTFRRRLSELEDADGSLTGQVVGPAAHEGVAALTVLLAALSYLTAEQHEALLMIGAQGYTYEEAAKLLGCRVGTVKSRVNRARGRLGDPWGPRCP